MAYYLASSQGSNNVVVLTYGIPFVVGANVGDYVEWAGFITNGINSPLVGIGTSFNSLINVRPGEVRFRPDDRSNNDFSTGYTQPATGEYFVLRIERVSANTWECFLDGQSIGQNTDSRNFSFDQLVRFSASGTPLEGGWYYFEMSDAGGAPTHRWDANDSGGTGITIPDSIGTEDATLENFPTDDSQWVFYSESADVTADIATTITAPTFASSAEVTLPQPSGDVAYTISAPTFAASADATLPQPSADAAYAITSPQFSSNAIATLPQPSGDVSFSVTKPSFSSNASASLPQPQADAAYNVDAPTFSALASVTIPGFNASVVYSVQAPTFSATADATQPQPSADVDYAIAAPMFSVQGEATLPQPDASGAFTVNAPQFSATATATEPGFNASVNYAVSSPTFAGSATATLPQPDIDAAFNVKAPTFSVVAIVGGIAIILDEETNINVPALSTNVDVPALSNNINL